jgi:hypothetical protein
MKDFDMEEMQDRFYLKIRDVCSTYTFCLPNYIYVALVYWTFICATTYIHRPHLVNVVIFTVPHGDSGGEGRGED